MQRPLRPSVVLALPLTGLLTALLVSGGCLTNEPDPELGGVYACVSDDDCPGTQACLQQTCEAITLPVLKILNPEDEKPFDFALGTPHEEILSVSATDLVLRQLSASNEAVPGEGHLVVFVDEMEVATIDTGDLSGGVQLPITIPNIPGVHRIRVQARLNDGTDYDNESAAARNLVWVTDGRQHVALRKPWPGQVFSLESQLINAEVATIGGVTIGPPMTMQQHVHVYYGETFPQCIDVPLCQAGYVGVVPNDDDDFGPVLLPTSGAGMVTLTALIADFDHTTYRDPMDQPVFSEIQILRSNN